MTTEPNGQTLEQNPEEAIRAYLAYLEDPQSLVDHELVAKLEEEIKAATDPIDRLLLMAQLSEVSSPNGIGLRDAFLVVVKPWADEYHVNAAMLRHMGVPPADLKAAGFDKVYRPRGRQAKK